MTLADRRPADIESTPRREAAGATQDLDARPTDRRGATWGPTGGGELLGGSPLAGSAPSSDELAAIILAELQNHVGPEAAISQLDLATAAGLTRASVSTRRRRIQIILNRIRDREELLILSSGRGVFLPSCPEDAEPYFARMTARVVAELGRIGRQRELLAAAFQGRGGTDGAGHRDRSASGRSGAPSPESGAPGSSRPCRCGCGRRFVPRTYNNRYLNDAHKTRHEKSFYRLGRTVAELGLEGFFR